MFPSKVQSAAPASVPVFSNESTGSKCQVSRKLNDRGIDRQQPHGQALKCPKEGHVASASKRVRRRPPDRHFQPGPRSPQLGPRGPQLGPRDPQGAVRRRASRSRSRRTLCSAASRAAALPVSGCVCLAGEWIPPALASGRCPCRGQLLAAAEFASVNPAGFAAGFAAEFAAKFATGEGPRGS